MVPISGIPCSLGSFFISVAISLQGGSVLAEESDWGFRDFVSGCEHASVSVTEDASAGSLAADRDLELLDGLDTASSSVNFSEQMDFFLGLTRGFVDDKPATADIFLTLIGESATFCIAKAVDVKLDESQETALVCDFTGKAPTDVIGNDESLRLLLGTGDVVAVLSFIGEVFDRKLDDFFGIPACFLGTLEAAPSSVCVRKLDDLCGVPAFFLGGVAFTLPSVVDRKLDDFCGMPAVFLGTALVSFPSAVGEVL